MNWQRGIVIHHRQIHEDDNAKHDNPPWIRTVRLEDGTEREFDWSRLCRDMTGESNTRVGSQVWVRSDGAISVHEPRTVDTP